MLSNSWPRESTGWGWLPGNGFAMGNLWIWWCRVSGRQGGASHSCQSNADTEFLPVLSPRAPAKVTNHRCHQSWACRAPRSTQETLQLMLMPPKSPQECAGCMQAEQADRCSLQQMHSPRKVQGGFGCQVPGYHGCLWVGWGKVS